MTHIEIVLGSTREDRFSAKVAGWVADRLSARDGFTFEVVDLRDYPMPFFDQAPPAYTQRDYPNDFTAALGRKLDAADGFIVLTPEYNHGYSAVLKNAIDHTFVEWNRKPMSFIGWGNVGGARAIEQLRLVAVELELAPLRHAVHVMPDVMIAARQEGADLIEIFVGLDERLDMLVTDLLWWTEALSAARARLTS